MYIYMYLRVHVCVCVYLFICLSLFVTEALKITLKPVSYYIEMVSSLQK